MFRAIVQKNSHILSVLAAALVFMSGAPSAQAQQFPSRLITIVVGYSAGGQADALARLVAKQLGDNLKVSVVVENKPGANGMIAGQAVARAAPDGYTVLMVTDAMVTIDPHLAGSNKFDLATAMVPVINMAWAPLLLATSKDFPADSVAALVELGKQKKLSLSFGSAGSSTPHRLAGEMLQKYGGFSMVHIPYKGTSASLTDLMGGQIPILFGAPTAVEPLATAGKIKVLGVTSEKRYPMLPDVPAISETFPQFNIISYLGLMLPKDTPQPVIAILNKEMNRILADDATRVWMEKQGMIALGGTPEEFRQRIESDYQARGDLVRTLGLTGE